METLRLSLCRLDDGEMLNNCLCYRRARPHFPHQTSRHLLHNVRSNVRLVIFPSVIERAILLAMPRSKAETADNWVPTFSGEVSTPQAAKASPVHAGWRPSVWSALFLYSGPAVLLVITRSPPARCYVRPRDLRIRSFTKFGAVRGKVRLSVLDVEQSFGLLPAGLTGRERGGGSGEEETPPPCLFRAGCRRIGPHPVYWEGLLQVPVGAPESSSRR